MVCQPINERSVRSATHEEFLMTGMPLTTCDFTAVSPIGAKLLAGTNVVNLQFHDSDEKQSQWDFNFADLVSAAGQQPVFISVPPDLIDA